MVGTASLVPVDVSQAETVNAAANTSVASDVLTIMAVPLFLSSLAIKTGVQGTNKAISG